MTHEEEDVSALLAGADRAWRDGTLAEARRLYARALELAPASWHAAFQLAWIDAAFGPLDPPRLEALRRPDLPERALVRLVALAERDGDVRRGQAEVLEGGVDVWDLVALRSRPEAADPRTWKRWAERAAAAFQHGLAFSAYEEAADVIPSFHYDMPRHVGEEFDSAYRHVAAIVEASKDTG